MTAAIISWNFFLAMIMRKVGVVFVVGCLMVVKLSEEMLLSVFVFGVFVE